MPVDGCFGQSQFISYFHESGGMESHQRCDYRKSVRMRIRLQQPSLNFGPVFRNAWIRKQHHKSPLEKLGLRQRPVLSIAIQDIPITFPHAYQSPGIQRPKIRACSRYGKPNFLRKLRNVLLALGFKYKAKEAQPVRIGKRPYRSPHSRS